MNGINSVKNYKYSFLVKTKNKKNKKLKKWREEVRQDPHLDLLLKIKNIKIKFKFKSNRSKNYIKHYHIIIVITDYGKMSKGFDKCDKI